MLKKVCYLLMALCMILSCTITLTAMGGELQQIFYDDFSNGAGQWSFSGAQYNINGGNLQLDWGRATPAFEPQKNFAVEYDYKFDTAQVAANHWMNFFVYDSSMPTQDDARVGFHLRGDTVYVWSTITGGGYYDWGIGELRSQDIINGFENNTQYKIKVVCENSVINCYVTKAEGFNGFNSEDLLCRYVGGSLTQTPANVGINWNKSKVNFTPYNQTTYLDNVIVYGTAQPVEQWNTIFEDDFLSGNLSKWTNGSNIWSVNNGSATTPVSNDTSGLTPQYTPTKNFAISADIYSNINSGGFNGIRFTNNTDSSKSISIIIRNGRTISVYPTTVGESWPFNPSLDWQADTFYTVKAQIVNGVLSVYVKPASKPQFEASDLIGSYIGPEIVTNTSYKASFYQWGGGMSIDNIRIDKAPTLEITSDLFNNELVNPSSKFMFYFNYDIDVETLDNITFKKDTENVEYSINYLQEDRQLEIVPVNGLTPLSLYTITFPTEVQSVSGTSAGSDVVCTFSIAPEAVYSGGLPTPNYWDPLPGVNMQDFLMTFDVILTASTQSYMFQIKFRDDQMIYINPTSFHSYGNLGDGIFTPNGGNYGIGLNQKISVKMSVIDEKVKLWAKYPNEQAYTYIGSANDYDGARIKSGTIWFSSWSADTSLQINATNINVYPVPEFTAALSSNVVDSSAGSAAIINFNVAPVTFTKNDITVATDVTNEADFTLTQLSSTSYMLVFTNGLVQQSEYVVDISNIKSIYGKACEPGNLTFTAGKLTPIKTTLQLKDSENNNVSMPATGDLKAVVTLSNNTGTTKTGKIVVAVCDGIEIKALVNTISNDFTLTGGQNDEITIEFNIPNTVVNPVVRILTWEGFDTAKPFSEKVEIQ